MFDNAEWLLGPACVVFLWPFIAVQVKRWQDMDCSAWWIYINVIPIAGPVWFVLKCGFAKGSGESNRYGDAHSEELGGTGDAGRVSRLFVVSVVLVFISTSLVDTFRVPANSMLPTLKPGDYIAVNRYSFGIPVPFSLLQFVSVRPPQRGDVVIFLGPHNFSIPFVKRVIGLPGDTIEIRGTAIILNGVAIEQKYVGDYSGTGSALSMNGAMHLSESLAETNYDILLGGIDSPTQGQWIVPSDKFFVLNDNRNNSHDSRHWGFVPKNHLIGKVIAIWFHRDTGYGGPSVSRISVIH
jgi:signal peptidase I